MSDFWTFEKGNQLNFLFNKNHYLILFTSLIFIIFFSMYVSRQRFKFQKIFVGIILGFLLIFEALRMFWRYKYLEYNSIEVNFLSLTDLNFYTLSLWISFPAILISLFSKSKTNKKLNFGLNFVVNISGIIAICSLIYPVGLNNTFQLYHCYNLLFILSRTFLITIAVFFAISKWISVEKFTDMWKSLASLVVFALFILPLAYFLNNGTNLLYFNFCPLFDEMGLHLNFPLQYLLLAVFFFVLQYIIFSPFRIRKYFKNRSIK